MHHQTLHNIFMKNIKITSSIRPDTLKMRPTRALLRKNPIKRPKVEPHTSDDKVFKKASSAARMKLFLDLKIEDPDLVGERRMFEHAWKMIFGKPHIPLKQRRSDGSMGKYLKMSPTPNDSEKSILDGLNALAAGKKPSESFYTAKKEVTVPEYLNQLIRMASSTYESEEAIKPYRKTPEGWSREKVLISHDHTFVKTSPTIEDINRPPRVGDLIDVSIKKNLSEIGIIGEVLPSGGLNVVMISGECRLVEGSVEFKMPFANPEVMKQFTTTVDDAVVTHLGIRPALVQGMTEFLRRAHSAKTRVLDMLLNTVIPQRVITLNDLVERMLPHMALQDTPLTPAMMYYATYLAVRSIPARWVIGPGQNSAIVLLYINAQDVAASEMAINTVREGGKTLNNIVKRFEEVLTGNATLTSLLLTPQERAILSLLKRYALGEISHNDMAAMANVGIFMRKLKDYGQVIITPTLCMDFLRRVGYIPEEINPWKKAFKLQIPYQGSSEQQDEIQTMYDGLTDADFTKDLSENGRKDWVGERRPFSHFYCIDGADAHEIDDGVALETRPDGSKYLHVLVADPASYFGVTSDVANAAQSRVTTAYYPSGVVGMLPQAVQKIGLLQKGDHVRSLVVSAKLNTTRNPNQGPIDISSARIRHVKVDGGVGLTYDHVERVLDGSQGSEHKADLQELHALSDSLRKHRIASGAFNLDIPKVKLNPETGKLEPVTESNPEATLLVSELMILANSLVGSFGAKNNIPLIYRYQDIDEVKQQAIKTRDLTTGVIPFKEGLAMWSTMERAYISADPKHHFSLAIPTYAQSTSPLRRYGDLLNHYQVHAFLQGETPPFSHADVQKIIPHVFARQQTVKHGQIDMEAYRLKEWLLKQTKSGELYPINWTAMVLEDRRENLVRVLIMELGLIGEYHLTSPDVEVGDVLPIGHIIDIDLMERYIKVAEKET